MMIPLHMRFSDVDSYGHINNVIMVRYFEDARVRLTSLPLRADGRPGANGAEVRGGAGTTEDSGTADVPEGSAGSTTLRETLDGALTVVVHQSVDYHRQLFFRTEPVYVRTWISRVGDSSFTIGYSLEEKDGSPVYASGESVMVLLDPDTGRTRKLTQQHKALLATLSDEPEEPHES